VHIPKDRGRTRPIGVSAVEDKIVQGALRELLEAVYEQDFHECSFGFRPGRGAHDAIRTLYAAISRGRMKWILEADIVSFFDSVDRAHLSELLQIRVPDGSVQRLVGKCLHVGVMDGEEFSTPDTGTTQGSVLSPLLGNVYLHYVLDLWFARDVKPRLTGEAVLVRYADDFVIAFETEEDAKRVYAALPKRLAKYGLQLHGEKTRLLPFSRPPWRATKGVATFDFLGFTWFWRKTRRNRWTVGCKTRSARLTRAIKAVNDWCRSHRHLAVKEQHSALVRRLRGHFNYFGVNGNMRSLEQVVQQVRRIWFKWLNRRSQRRSFTWEVFDEQLLAAFPLPVPRITVQIWGE
jgi:group II intron reverse transcriptase/maturase